MGRTANMKVPEPRKLSSGRWFIQLRLNGVSVPITANTKTDAINQARSIKAEYKANKLSITKENPITLAQAIDDYIKSKQRVLSPSTIRGYQTIKRTRFKRIMNKPVCKVRDWQSVINDEADTCSAKTLKSAWSLVHAALSATGMNVPNIALPQVVPAVRPWLDVKQSKAFVKLVSNESFAIPALLALHGLRRSEIMGLWWSNVDMDNNVIHIHGSTVRAADGGFIDKDTNKNSTSKRSVPIMIPELKKALSLVPEEKRIGKVCTGSFDRIWEKINCLCRDNGLPQVGFHGLRHSFASIGYSLGVSELEMMKLGGWSDTQTMRKIYTHISAADMLKTENAIAAFFSDNTVNFANEIANAV